MLDQKGKASHLYILLFFVFFVFTPASFGQTKLGASLTLRVTDGKEILPLAVCQIRALQLYTATNEKGVAVWKDLPAGQVLVEVSYLGFEKYEKTISLTGDTHLEVALTNTSLALNEVSVVAKTNTKSLSSSSIIGRQALDHVQAMSLADVVQLLPGQLFTNTDLTSKSNLQLRTLQESSNNAFGASVIVDGVPISSNTYLGSTGSYSSTDFAGVDLRQVATDNAESIEVIQGIASAEYGDLTSGAVVVNTKTGLSPLEWRMKINPTAMNTSVGQGVKLGKNKGILNLNLDYAQAWSDPRKKTRSFHRYNAGATYSHTFFNQWYTTTSVKYSGLYDWNGNDPDAVADGTESKERNASLSFSHRGRSSPNKPFARTISYTLSATFNSENDRTSTIVTNSSGFLPILTATETGYHVVPYETSSYKASGGTKSRATSIYAKATNAFFLNYKTMHHQFNMGLEYRYEATEGMGYYNDNERYPLKPNENGRPRAYSDIPALQELSSFFEDNVRWKLGPEQILRLAWGGRFSILQPGKTEQVAAFSPRINGALDLNKTVTLRGGYGLSEKTPGLVHLYPAKKYNDRIAANYIPVNAPEEALVMYHTNVYNVERTSGLKNMRSEKVEIGTTIYLPQQRNLSITLFKDKTTRGFGSAPDMYTYAANFYSATQGLIIQSGEATTVDWNNPARTDTIFASKGKISNSLVTQNKGAEFDFNLGAIPAIRTSFILSGAYIESESYSSDLNITSPKSLPAIYSQTETTPFKLVYPSSLSLSSNQRFSTTLRAVCNIPQLRMVFSLANQIVWYNYSHSMTQGATPLAWIDTDMSYHTITDEMLADANYTIKGVYLSKQYISENDNPATRYPKTWMMNIRLNKELGATTGLSFYVNNFLYLEPFKSTSTSSTLSQQNEGSFNFGVELYFHF